MKVGGTVINLDDHPVPHPHVREMMDAARAKLETAMRVRQAGGALSPAAAQRQSRDERAEGPLGSCGAEVNGQDDRKRSEPQQTSGGGDSGAQRSRLLWMAERLRECLRDDEIHQILRDRELLPEEKVLRNAMDRHAEVLQPLLWDDGCAHSDITESCAEMMERGVWSVASAARDPVRAVARGDFRNAFERILEQIRMVLDYERSFRSDLRGVLAVLAESGDAASGVQSSGDC